MNVLLSCVGRRDYLVEYFRQALNGSGEVLATNSYAEAAGMLAADRAFVLPRVDDPGYIEALLELCARERVGLLLSLFDLDVAVLTPMRDRFLSIGTVLVASSPDVVELCFDKWRSHGFLTGIGLRSPRTYLSLEDARRAVADGSLAFPLVVKPRWGTGSIALEYAEDLEELDFTYKRVRKRLAGSYLACRSLADLEHDVLIQERLVGIEYGLDVVNDLRGEQAACFVKQKLEMRSGETDRAVTLDDPQLEAVGLCIAGKLRHVGNLDVDIIRVGSEPYVLEMNPRFGGLYPFSHVAGANIPAALLAWARGEEPLLEWLKVRPNVLSVKGIRMLSASESAEAGSTDSVFERTV